MNTLHCPNCGAPTKGGYCATCSFKASEISKKGLNINPYNPPLIYQPNHLERMENDLKKALFDDLLRKI